MFTDNRRGGNLCRHCDSTETTTIKYYSNIFILNFCKVVEILIKIIITILKMMNAKY